MLVWLIAFTKIMMFAANNRFAKKRSLLNNAPENTFSFMANGEILIVSLKKAGAAEFVVGIFVFALSYNFCGNSADNFEWFDIACDDCTCRHNCPFANFNAWQDD